MKLLKHLINFIKNMEIKLMMNIHNMIQLILLINYKVLILYIYVEHVDLVMHHIKKLLHKIYHYIFI